MNLPIIRLAPTRADLRAIALYIGRNSPQAAGRFLDAADRTFVRLAARPGLGAPHLSDNPRLSDLRVAPVTGFRSYLIFYRATDDRLEILRVLHGARDVDRLLADTLPPADAP